MKTRRVLAALLAAGISNFAFSSLGSAEAISANGLHPWEEAQAIVAATEADLAMGGILTVGKHADELEQALADARQAYETAGAGADTVYVLANGQAEVLAGVFAASASGRYAVAIENPYPLASSSRHLLQRDRRTCRSRARARSCPRIAADRRYARDMLPQSANAGQR